MSVPKHWLLGGWYPWGLIVYQQRYRLSDSNKNVDIKFMYVTMFAWNQYSDRLYLQLFVVESMSYLFCLIAHGGVQHDLSVWVTFCEHLASHPFFSCGVRIAHLFSFLWVFHMDQHHFPSTIVVLRNRV